MQKGKNQAARSAHKTAPAAIVKYAVQKAAGRGDTPKVLNHAIAADDSGSYVIMKTPLGCPPRSSSPAQNNHNDPLERGRSATATQRHVRIKSAPLGGADHLKKPR